MNRPELGDKTGADVTIPNESDYFEMMACLANSLHMSASVIEQIRNGAFTFDQVDKLITQKEHLIAILKKAENSTGENTPPTPQAVQKYHESNSNIIASVGCTPAYDDKIASSDAPLPMTPAGTPTNTPSESTNSTPIRIQSNALDSPEHPKCSFQVCHACRPFFQDRLYQSFEAVLYDAQPAVTEDEIQTLPLLSPDVLRFVGLREPLQPVTLASHISEESMDIVYQQLEAIDGSDDSWTPSSGSSSDFDVEGNESIQEPYPCPGAGICPLYSRETGCAYDQGYADDHRAINHGFQNVDLSVTQQSYQHTPEHSRQRLRHMGNSIMDTPAGTSSTGSSISLPTPVTLPLTPTTSLEDSFNTELYRKLKIGKAASVCGVLDGSGNNQRGLGLDIRGTNSSSSSLGSEVEVEGGVALTEEAVGGGAPDIATGKERSGLLAPKV